MNITNLTPQQLRKAADIQERIVTLQAQLNDILGGEGPTATPLTVAANKPKQGALRSRKMSAAGRAAISAAAKARWAKLRAAKGKSTTPVKQPKNQRSAAWRAALASAAKARWAKAKAAGKSRL